MSKLDYAQQQFHLAPLFDQEDGALEDDLLGDEELLSASHLLTSEPGTYKSGNEPGDVLLDESSLETILDMLAVISSMEELMLLEALTDAQKRQVWSATPEEIRSKLKQIREAGFAESVPWQTEAGDGNQVGLSVGNQVVLMAKPKLVAAELIAIWEVMAVHEGYARIRANNLGVRNYPISWMVLYAGASSDQA